MNEGHSSESVGEAGIDPETGSVPESDSIPESDPKSEADSGPEPGSLTALRFVGPATAAVLDGAGVSQADVRERRVSYRDLVEAGVNAGVAARIRREHSLSWSFDSSGDDLGRRSAQVRGLDDEERAWVAASSGDWESTATSESDGETTGASEGGANAGGATSAIGTGDWDPAAVRSTDPAGDAASRSTEADGSGDPRAAESAWRERSAPEPVTELDGVDEDVATDLAEAGVTSIRRLSTIDPEHVADALLLDAELVREWHEAARAHRR